MKNLNLLLSANEPSERPAQEISAGLNEVSITRYAYEKAFRYAQLVMERKGRSVEVGGFLTVPKESQDRIARDAFLARDQEVRVGFYDLTADDVAKAAKELESDGKRVIGWWHSHGRFKTFHSDTDKKNQMVLLNQIAPSNYVTLTHEEAFPLQSRVEGDVLTFWDKSNPNRVYQLDIRNEDPAIVATRLRITREKQIGFAYSFVVNHHRWLQFRVPYCEIATRDACVGCFRDTAQSRRTGYRIIDEGEFSLDNDELIAEIDERVHLYGTRKKYFLPQDFERERAQGSLKKPQFGSVVDGDSATNYHYPEPINYTRRYWKK